MHLARSIFFSRKNIAILVNELPEKKDISATARKKKHFYRSHHRNAAPGQKPKVILTTWGKVIPLPYQANFCYSVRYTCVVI